MMHGEIQGQCPDSVLYRSQKPKSPAQAGFLLSGGERGIRTLDGLLTHTPLAGERLQPLGHLSVNLFLANILNGKKPDAEAYRFIGRR